MTRTFAKHWILTGTLMVAAALGAGSAQAAGEKITIGIAMPFQGNGWQKGFLAAAQWAASEITAKGDKTVELTVVDAAGDTQTQIQQINNMTLQGVDFIILEPLSDTALNGAIDNAVGAGIPVLTTALGSVTNQKAIDLQFDYNEFSEKYVSYVAERTGGKGNALNIRGLAGNAAEQAIQDAYVKALAKYPDIKLVAEVYGDWNQSVAQQRVSAILPTLPQIDIIFSQGVAAFGAAQAFMAAGRDVPLQVYGFDGVDTNLLLELNAKSGYQSVAINTDPGIGGVAVNVAVAKLGGVDVPMKMILPVPTITMEDLRTTYKGMADSDIAWLKYTYDWTMSNMIKAK
ncbi:ABC transporter substrate-binding protein [Rhizobium sp. Leaf371]|uniref:substrate-binding domain-containing protein n=1 Tax=Rhizobium sp. Leaf371 TaxID=1736355 RepID=UPI000714A84C|nr:substrate-binding domain-containing protein [Rhizobium sp. Leaf371]KQS59429.1 ABC transporter substrate-binding protein [Rhizobium sp. Leaf371]